MSGGTFGKVYTPSVSAVTVASVVPRVLLMSVTVAPGMTPPCASLMFPVTVPVVTCAAAGIASAHTAIATASTRRVVLNIRAPPLAPTRDPPLAYVPYGTGFTSAPRIHPRVG